VQAANSQHSHFVYSEIFFGQRQQQQEQGQQICTQHLCKIGDICFIVLGGLMSWHPLHVSTSPPSHPQPQDP